MVPQADAVAFAQEIGATYIETSAKTAHNVAAMFTETIPRLRAKHAHVPPEIDVKGRLSIPPNPQSTEAPLSAIAAVASQLEAKALAGGDPSVGTMGLGYSTNSRGGSTPAQSTTRLSTSSGMPALGIPGPIYTAPMPRNKLLSGGPGWDDSDDEEYGGDGVFRAAPFPNGMLTSGPGSVPQPLPVSTNGLNGPTSGHASPGGGASARGPRSRSGTNASIPPPSAWSTSHASSSRAGGGSANAPPLPPLPPNLQGLYVQEPYGVPPASSASSSAREVSAFEDHAGPSNSSSSRRGKESSTPHKAMSGKKKSGFFGTGSSGSEKAAKKEKSGKKKDKDGGCVVM